MTSPFVALWFLTGTVFLPAPAAPGPLDAVAGIPYCAFGERVAELALTFVGRPYRLGGENPRTGLDCTALVRLVFRSLGIDLPRTVGSQVRFGREVPRNEIEAGDLIFFRDTSRRGLTHVGIAIGNGRFVHASLSSGVRISSLLMPYYRRHYASARRLPEKPPDEAFDPPAVGSADEPSVSPVAIRR
ncbi:MAG TPA: C40 family peptidase [Thermoanaerobaculia bacterium]|nr:C40 family peptidase [Thermoanaerobaculia bacterium]